MDSQIWNPVGALFVFLKYTKGDDAIFSSAANLYFPRFIFINVAAILICRNCWMNFIYTQVYNPMGKMNVIKKKNRCLTSHIRHEKKNCMRRHTIFPNYCCYYSRYYYRMMTVVTTVATRHGIMTSLYHVR